MPPSAAPTQTPPQRALLAGPAATLQTFAPLLARAHYTVATAASVAEVLTLLERSPLDLLLLDLDLPELSPTALTRITIQAQQVPTLGLHAPATRPDLLTLAKTRLRALLGKPVGAAALLRTLVALRGNPAAPAPAGAAPPPRPATAPARSAAASAARHVEGNRSLLARAVQCPLHGQPVAFTYYTLRTGKVLTETNYFDLPVYLGAAGAADFCNYHLFAVLVCPECLFASGNPGYFLQPDQRRPAPSELTGQAQAALRERAAARQSRAGTLGPTFHTHQRTLDEALVAQELALDAAAACIAVDPDYYAIEMTRAANYHLRAALLRELRQAPDQSFKEAAKLPPPPEAVEHYRQALAQLIEAYVRLQGPALYKTMYQLTAVGIYLGDDEAAHRAIECLRRLDAKPDLPAADRPLAARYLNRCQTAWEDRDGHRLAAPAAR